MAVDVEERRRTAREEADENTQALRDLAAQMRDGEDED